MYSVEILLSKLANAEQHDIFLAKTFCYMEFLGGPVVRTWHFSLPGSGFNPWLAN